MLKLRLIIICFITIAAITLFSFLFYFFNINNINTIDKYFYNNHNINYNNTIKNKNTLIVVSAFWRVAMVEAMLLSIINYVDYVDVVIVESKSPYSDAMFKMLQKYVKRDLIILHIYTSKNIFGTFMPLGYISGILYNQSHIYDNICVSDGDVIMYGDWLEEVNRILSISSVFGVCCSLNPFNNPNSNWIMHGPNQVDYIEAITGIQMQCFYIKSFELMFKDSKIHYQDTFLSDWVIRNFKNKRIVRTKENYVVHMTWSIYQLPNGIYKDYLDFKKSVSDLWSNYPISTLNITIMQGRNNNLTELAYRIKKYVNIVSIKNITF